jgi:hypothetical protein
MYIYTYTYIYIEKETVKKENEKRGGWSDRGRERGLA